MSIFRKKKEVPIRYNAVEPEETFERIFSKLTVEQEARIREMVHRRVILRENSAGGNDYSRAMLGECDMLLAGYLEGLESCGIITAQDNRDLTCIIMNARFGELTFKTLVMRERGML